LSGSLLEKPDALQEQLNHARVVECREGEGGEVQTMAGSLGQVATRLKNCTEGVVPVENDAGYAFLLEGSGVFGSSMKYGSVRQEGVQPLRQGVHYKGRSKLRILSVQSSLGSEWDRRVGIMRSAFGYLGKPGIEITQEISHLPAVLGTAERD